MKSVLKKCREHYEWVIVTICFLMIFICLGFCSSNRGLFIAPITEALSIERSAYSLNISIRYIVTAVVNMFFGALVFKYGTKKLITAGLISLILSMVVSAVGESVIAFWISGALLGLGLSWTTTTMIGTVVNRWCTKNKGTVMGAVLASNGIGGAVSAQIFTPLIMNNDDPFGYRKVFWITAIILFALLILVTIFYKEKKRNPDELTQGKPKKKAREGTWSGIEFSTVRKMLIFYCTLACIFVTGMVLQGMQNISTTHLMDVGFSALFIANINSVKSLILTFSKFFAGFLYDRKGLRITTAICTVSGIAATLVLAVMTPANINPVIIALFVLATPIALPLETIMLPIFASDLFGLKSYEKNLGIFVSVNTAGYALGVPVMNLFYDVFGSYRYGLYLLAILLTSVLIGFRFIIRKAEKIKAEIEN